MATFAGHLICGDSAEGYRLASNRETSTCQMQGKVDRALYSSTPLAAGRAWIVCGRPMDRVDNEKAVAHTRPQPTHPRPEYFLGRLTRALRA